jgi:hypothetical protein
VGHDERGAGQIMSSKLYRVLAVLIVVMLISAGLYKSLISNSNGSWEKVSFENIKVAMQKGVVEMHWQWQYEGRPISILYETRQSQRVDIVVMNKDGWPAIEKSKEACVEFLDTFAGSVLVEVSGLELNVDVQKQLGIQIEFVVKQDTSELDGEINVCRYSRTDQQFEYQLGTGNLF